jgi:hypothetical protein
MPSRPVIDPLRQALLERAAVESVHAIADRAGVDYRRLLAFSKGGPAAFDALDIDRLAACLGLRLTYDLADEPKQPAKAAAGRKAR